MCTKNFLLTSDITENWLSARDFLFIIYILEINVNSLLHKVVVDEQYTEYLFIRV